VTRYVKGLVEAPRRKDVFGCEGFARELVKNAQFYVTKYSVYPIEFLGL
jgi:hypothetical protein